jgi:hypothetical protein
VEELLFSVNVLSDSDVRQIVIHTAELLVLGLSRLEVEITIAKLKKYKLPGTDSSRRRNGQKPINTLILFGIGKNCLITGRSVSVYKKGTGRISLLSTSYKILSNIVLSGLNS